jgi:hypothetical protein
LSASSQQCIRSHSIPNLQSASRSGTKENNESSFGHIARAVAPAGADEPSAIGTVKLLELRNYRCAMSVDGLPRPSGRSGHCRPEKWTRPIARIWARRFDTLIAPTEIESSVIWLGVPVHLCRVNSGDSKVVTKVVCRSGLKAKRC